MIPYWYYLIGFIPIVILVFPNKRKVRVILAIISGLGLLYIWSGMSKVQAIERDFVRWSIRDLATRVQKGQTNAVCSALAAYGTTYDIGPFDGFAFRKFMQEQLTTTEEQHPNQASQAIGAPGAPQPER